MRIRGYAAGTLCWAEVASPDAEASRRFYGALFGWAGDDRVFSLDGRPVAGLRPLARGEPPSWLAHIATEDASATVATARAAGGVVREPVADVVAGAGSPPLGRCAVLADPSGAEFAVWQRGAFFGAQLQTEPGALSWSELATSDVDGAARFYGAVFGWQAVPDAGAGNRGYYEWLSYADSVAGLVPLHDGLAPHWTVSFMATDCQTACDRVTSLGGTVSRKPAPVATGWQAYAADPHGAQFAVLELNPALLAALL